MRISHSNSMSKAIGLVFVCAGAVSAQTNRTPLRLAWMRHNAIPVTVARFSTVKVESRHRLASAPQFLPTLHAAFPQHQWFWRDHGRFLSVAELADRYLGTSLLSPDWDGSTQIENGRYVTEAGCVEGVCGETGANGMLWADTSEERPWIVFAAVSLAGVSKGPDTHLWLFTSRTLDVQKVPDAFLSSLHRWMQIESVTQATNVGLVNIVQPTGEQVDLDLASLQAATRRKQNNESTQDTV